MMGNDARSEAFNSRGFKYLQVKTEIVNGFLKNFKLSWTIFLRSEALTLIRAPEVQDDWAIDFTI